MKSPFRFAFAVVSAAFFIAGSALAQNAGTVTNHAYAIGKGPGTTGYTSLLCGSAQLAVGQAAADPICKTVTGDVTISATGVTAVGSNKITNGMLRQSVALSLLGNSTNATANVADISAVAASDCVFRESASTVGCGTIATNGIANNAVTNAKLRQSAGLSVIGNSTASTANVADITGTADQVLRVAAAGASAGFGSIDLSKSAAVGTSILALANGGCNAALTASNGGILWSNASQCQILAGTATARLPLLSGASATPVWGAYTLPASVTSGGIPYFSSTSAESSSALLTANAIMLGGGAGAAPATLGSLGTTTTVLHGNAAGAPTFAAVTGSDMASNTVANSNLAQAPAATIKGNPTVATANVSDFTIQGLTNLAAPSATLDFIPIFDHVAGTIKNVTPGAIASSATAGVSSLNTKTGALTLSVVKQIFTASGTYTPTTGMVYAVIECIGGGGGAGSAAGTAGQIFGGGGGGSGGYSRLVASAATIGASKAVTIGTAGTGGAAGSNAGTAGGDTSVSTLCIGKGGAGGSFGSAAQVPTAGAGGVAGTGDFIAAGAPGLPGFYNAVNANITFPSGGGGSSAFGGGAQGVNAAGTAVTGGNASNYGSGGSGGQAAAAANAAGGNGSAGVVFITEYIVN